MHPYISAGLQLKPPLLYLKITLNKTRAALENSPQVETDNGLTYLASQNTQKSRFSLVSPHKDIRRAAGSGKQIAPQGQRHVYLAQRNSHSVNIENRDIQFLEKFNK